MKQQLLFELQKMKKKRWTIFLVAFVTEMTVLYFFSIVGRLSSESGSDILNTYAGIGGLANTVVMCVMIIYGSVVMNKIVTEHYITNSRARLYLYPNGRSQLYFLKNLAFLIGFGGLQLLGSLSGSFIYILTEIFYPITNAQAPILNFVLLYATIPLSTLFLTVSVISVSSIIGIMLKSSNATIVSGIIGLTFVSNIVAMLFAQYPYIIFIATFILFLVSFITIKINAGNIQNDEIMYNKKK